MERHFSEEQVSNIIKRAAEVQARQRPLGAVSQKGVSESELLRVAGELGIDSSALVAAISEMGTSTAEDSGTINSVDRILERTIDSDLPVDTYAILLEEFIPASGFSGPTVSIGNSLNYQSMAGMAQCNINVSQRNGRTSLRVKSNAFLAALPTFIPGVVLSLISNVIIWQEISMVGEMAFFFAFLFPILILSAAYFAFRKIVRYTNNKILNLANRAAAKLAESADHLRGRFGSAKAQELEVESSVEQTRL